MKRILRALMPFGPLADPIGFRYYLGAAMMGFCIVLAIFWVCGCSGLPTQPLQRNCLIFNDTTGFSLENKRYYNFVDSINGCQKPFPSAGTN